MRMAKKHSSIMSAEQSKQGVTAAPDIIQHVNDDAAARLQIAPLVCDQHNTSLQGPLHACKPASMDTCMSSSQVAFTWCQQGWRSPARVPHSASPCRLPVMLAFVEAILRLPGYTQVAAAADRLLQSTLPQQMYTRSDC